MYYIGIDLGTSAVKLLLMDETGSIANIVSREYPIAFPHPGWSEQDPADWWAAVCDGIPALLDGFDASQVKGIGAGGQMHGLVVLDKNDTVIRPCILWNDGRTQRQVDYLNGVIGKDKLSRYTANIAFAGFTAPKLLWMQENEPDNFARIEKIMLPKDYINYKLTGVHCTDYSDASGMLLLDVEHKCWSKEMLDICGVQESQLPKLFGSWQPVGTLTAEAAQTLGLPADVVVCAGAGDNAAAAVGCGAVGGGKCNISLGTSGTVFITSDTFGVDKQNALHSFAFEGESGMHTMDAIMKQLRQTPPTAIGGMAVESLVDYNTAGTGLPKANVLEFRLAGGAKLMVRPSGTEPKIKVYLSAVAPTEEAADAINDTLGKAASALLKA